MQKESIIAPTDNDDIIYKITKNDKDVNMSEEIEILGICRGINKDTGEIRIDTSKNNELSMNKKNIIDDYVNKIIYNK